MQLVRHQQLGDGCGDPAAVPPCRPQGLEEMPEGSVLPVPPSGANAPKYPRNIGQGSARGCK